MSIRRSNVTDAFSSDQLRELLDDDYPYPYPRASSSCRPSSGLSFQPGTTSFFNAHVDWKVTPEAHVFKVDLPGIKKEEVKVEVQDGILLQISGERTREKQEKTDTWHLIECNCGEFLRKFLLPGNAKMEQIKAAMENGVLTVTVPKEKVKKPGIKSVEISG